MANTKAAKTPQKTAFISVFDKTGIEPVARALVETYGYALLSTGGTKKFLEEKGLPVTESSEITGFDELLGGRVKSLHPTIFAGILAERANPEHMSDPKIDLLIDTVIVNLYPFEEESASVKAKEDPEHLIHFIDIGGSALIRAAGKNCASVNILSSPAQYDVFLQELKLGNGDTSASYRRQLALEAFQRSVSYDTAITAYFASRCSDGDTSGNRLPGNVLLPLKKIHDLRYGENPHQQAALYGLGNSSNKAGAVDFELLHGKPLSYNNILDMQAGWNLVVEFTDLPVCAVIKHNNPCGVAASRDSITDAYQKAFDCDPLSAFGGVIALNQPVTRDIAKQMKDVFLEVVIAPGFEPEALEILQTKKNLRLVKRGLPEGSAAHPLEFKQVSSDLFLLQTVDAGTETRIEALIQAQEPKASVVTKHQPTPQALEDMIFAWKVVKHVKSNAVVLAKDLKTIGIGGGQTSRIGALEIALNHACDEAKDAVLASDGFLPHEDNVHAAVQARVAAIIQPGGSIKDEAVIDLANQHDIAMVTTGIREFRH